MSGRSLLLVGAALLLSGCAKLTRENYEKIESGMTKQQVIALLGEPTQVESAGLMGLSGAALLWQDSEISVSVTLVNDKVVLKNLSKRAVE